MKNNQIFMKRNECKYKVLFSLFTFILITSLVFTIAGVSAGDTGTYKIQDYSVKLTPKSDGKVEIEYYQKWLVTGGSIPWITVGVPNSNFSIIQEKNSGAIKRIGQSNDGSWSGVRIDLNKDYRPNESFEVRFNILQDRLFYADQNDYRLDFTPGWYDNAETGKLKIEVFFFAKIDTVTAKPEPVKKEGQSMFWEKSNLRKGEKFSISVSFPKSFFPKPLQKESASSKDSSGKIAIKVIVVAIVLLVLILVFVSASKSSGSSDDDYGSGGSVSYGSSRGSSGSSSSSSSSSRSSGGGGGFGGRSVSCHCACVSCACACACAGGGGAGCDRKIKYRCPLCKECKKKSECPIWKGKLT